MIRRCPRSCPHEWVAADGHPRRSMTNTRIWMGNRDDAVIGVFAKICFAPRHCAMAGAALDSVLLGKYLPHHSRKFGIGKVEQTPIAAHPLKSVQQPSDFPLPVDTREAVLVPAVLSVLAVAAVCSTQST